jgi:tyrosine-protein kinase Etk/Wzc
MNDLNTNRNDNLVGQSQPLEQGLNFKTILGKFLAFIPYFILSITISFTVAFLVNRYSNPRYLVKGTILIKEKGANKGGLDGADNFLQGMQLLSTSRNIENEQGIIRSKGVVIAT